ncbi:hypothetical protein HA402_015735 [Bradysia odoriphaga]|nr:hypothetical protein HA402_015735 [Bradysia odoriphaga]
MLILQQNGTILIGEVPAITLIWLVNPRVVRACTIVLADWEKITTRALKSAVTILHRISFGCKVPAMMYQASLFRIFQSVFHAPNEEHSRELKKLGIYIVRQFVAVAPSNPKIYAEMLFLKSLREANDIEMGYDTVHETDNKRGWSEEQEDELRHLYMENQNNPQTDQDVIDWILDNLIDKTRTRRMVIKKLKDLGLIFKAPTKKSNALPKNTWLFDQDQRLRDLYDENRLHDDCLAKIEAEFDGRSKNAIIKRMIALGLIADRSEIVPRKAKKSNKKSKSAGRSDDDDDKDVGSNDESDNEADRVQTKRPKKQAKPKKTTKPAKKPIVKVPFKLNHLKTLLSEMNDSLKLVLPWLQESLSDAAEDMEETPNDGDNGVPLVPFTMDQSNAMDDENFKFFLTALGIQPPVEQMETYWRIPVYFTLEDLNLRVQLLAGELDDEEEEQIQQQQVAQDDVEMEPIMYSTDDDEDEESDVEISSKPKSPVKNLMYNDSDNDDDTHRTPMKRNATIEQKKDNAKRKFDIFDMIKEPESEEVAMQSQELRNRLATLIDSDDDSDNETITRTKSVNKSHHRNAIVDTDSEDEKENTVLISSANDAATTTTKSLPSTTLDSHFDSSAFDGNHSSHSIGINVSDDVNGTRNNKRERSESDESMVDGENVVANKKARKLVSRRAVIDDDDDE